MLEPGLSQQTTQRGNLLKAMIKKLLNTAVLLTVILILQNCAGVPQTYYYQIDYAMPAAGSQALPINLGVTQFKADIPYQGDRIVYRSSQYEVQYYHYRRWVAPPVKLAEQMTVEQFMKSGAFRQVSSLPFQGSVDYILGGNIEAFEEWDEDKAWFGNVRILFHLTERKSGEVVWQKAFSKKTAAAKREPVEVVKAISESMRQVLSEAQSEVVGYLQARQ